MPVGVMNSIFKFSGSDVPLTREGGNGRKCRGHLIKKDILEIVTGGGLGVKLLVIAFGSRENGGRCSGGFCSRNLNGVHCGVLFSLRLQAKEIARTFLPLHDPLGLGVENCPLRLRLFELFQLLAKRGGESKNRGGRDRACGTVGVAV